MAPILAEIPLFQELSDPERRALVSVSRMRHLKKGEWLFREGAPADSVWVLWRGCVYLTQRTRSQGTMTLSVLTPHEAICGISAFEAGRYSAGAVAATGLDAIEIPWEAFSQALDGNPRFARQVLLACCQRIRQMAETIALARTPAAYRLTHTLLRLRDAFGRTIPATHQTLAQMAGVRWETSIRVLSAMRRRGWLQTARGRITLLAPAQLRRALSCNGPALDNHHG